MTDGQANFTKWFRSEVMVAFAIGSVVAGGISYINSPVHSLETQMAVVQNTIAELKSNDLVHIELEQTRMNGTLESQQSQIADMNVKMTQALTILQEIKRK